MSHRQAQKEAFLDTPCTTRHYCQMDPGNEEAVESSRRETIFVSHMSHEDNDTVALWI